MRTRITHERIDALFLFLGASLPVVITFGIVYFAPHLYEEGVHRAAPLLQEMRAQVASTHDARALNAFDVALGGGALFGMYFGLVVGRVLSLIQRFVEHRLGTRPRVEPEGA